MATRRSKQTAAAEETTDSSVTSDKKDPLESDEPTLAESSTTATGPAAADVQNDEGETVSDPTTDEGAAPQDKSLEEKQAEAPEGVNLEEQPAEISSGGSSPTDDSQTATGFAAFAEQERLAEEQQASTVDTTGTTSSDPAVEPDSVSYAGGVTGPVDESKDEERDLDPKNDPNQPNESGVIDPEKGLEPGGGRSSNVNDVVSEEEAEDLAAGAPDDTERPTPETSTESEFEIKDALGDQLNISANKDVTPEAAQQRLDNVTEPAEVPDKIVDTDGEERTADEIIKRHRFEVLSNPSLFSGVSGQVDTSGTSGQGDAASLASVADVFSHPASVAVHKKSAEAAGAEVAEVPSVFESANHSARAAAIVDPEDDPDALENAPVPYVGSDIGSAR